MRGAPLRILALAAVLPLRALAGSSAAPSTGEAPPGAASTAAETPPDTEDVSGDVAVEEAANRPLQTYGFFDFGLQKLLVPRTSFLYPLAATHATTFLFGNLNLFFDAQPRSDWRTLVELRFTNLPHGEIESLRTPVGGEFRRTDRTGLDSTSPNGRNRILFGSVIIERAQAQWTASDAFEVLVGYWFTPYGIWNLDHGTPTLISLLLPDAQVREYFPLRQLGVQVLGSLHAPPLRFGYHLTVSNGRTLGQVDLDENKAVGARAYLTSRSGSGHLEVGLSGYHGTYGEVESVITSFVPLEATRVETLAATEWGASADLSLDHAGLRLRSEGTLRRVVFEPGRRPRLGTGRPDATQPDRYDLNAYVLVAHRFPESVFEPYLYLEVIHGPNPLGDTTFVPSVGLNVHFAPEVQLKTQVAHVVLRNLVTETAATSGRNDFSILTSRLVVSF